MDTLCFTTLSSVWKPWKAACNFNLITKKIKTNKKFGPDSNILAFPKPGKGNRLSVSQSLPSFPASEKDKSGKDESKNKKKKVRPIPSHIIKALNYFLNAC